MHRFRRGAALLVSGDFHERHACEWQHAPKCQTDFLWRKPQREAACRGNACSGEDFGCGEARRVCAERFAPGHKRERHRSANEQAFCGNFGRGGARRGRNGGSGAHERRERGKRAAARQGSLGHIGRETLANEGGDHERERKQQFCTLHRKGTELHLMVCAQIECGVHKALVACEAGDARP